MGNGTSSQSPINFGMPELSASTTPPTKDATVTTAALATDAATVPATVPAAPSKPAKSVKKPKPNTKEQDAFLAKAAAFRRNAELRKQAEEKDVKEKSAAALQKRRDANKFVEVQKHGARKKLSVTLYEEMQPQQLSNDWQDVLPGGIPDFDTVLLDENVDLPSGRRGRVEKIFFDDNENAMTQHRKDAEKRKARKTSEANDRRAYMQKNLTPWAGV